MDHPTQRYDVAALRWFAAALLGKTGLSGARADTVARILVEGDLLGHTTHGLQLLPAYLRELEAGTMARTGEPEVISDRGATLAWNGRRLPGPWLVCSAIETALARVATHGVVTVVIGRSHHIACLAAYLKEVTDRGLVILLMSSDPAAKSVAPFGSARPLYTPNPIAAGFPTEGDPILLDVSMSLTTNGLSARLRQEGRKFEHRWLLDADGRPTDDPEALFTEPTGSILPLGGLDAGHKGFALGLLVEALTSGLAGIGRARKPEGWGASVFLQVIDPAAFGGRTGYTDEIGFLAREVAGAPPLSGRAVRLPGARGLALRARQLAGGVALYPTIMPALEPWAQRLGVPLPAPSP